MLKKMVCINEAGFEERLTKGKVYQVDSKSSWGHSVVFFTDDKGGFMEASQNRFVESPTEKISCSRHNTVKNIEWCEDNCEKAKSCKAKKMAEKSITDLVVDILQENESEEAAC